MLRQSSQKYNISEPFLVSSSQWLSPGMFGHLFPPASFSRYVWASLPPCILFVHSPSSTTRLMPFPWHQGPLPWQLGSSSQPGYAIGLTTSISFPWCWSILSMSRTPPTMMSPLLVEHWCHSNIYLFHIALLINGPPTVECSPPSEHWMKSNRVVHSLGFWSPSHSSSQSSSDNHILPTSGFKSSFLVC